MYIYTPHHDTACVCLSLQTLLVKPLLTLGKMYPDLLQYLLSSLENEEDQRLQALSHTLQTTLE